MKSDNIYSGIIAGTMTWGQGGRKYSTAQMTRLIGQCVEMGISSFDHADIYGGYTTEAEFGRAFSASRVPRESVQFITKCGIQYVCEARPVRIKHYEYSADYIISSAMNSLKHLETEYLDMLLLHRPSPLMEPEEVAAAFASLKDTGRVRSFGVSNFTPSQIRLIETAVPVEAHQFECSLTAEGPLWDGMLDDCIIGKRMAMAWSPLGAYYRNEDQRTLRIRECLAPLCAKYDATESQLLLAWLLRHPAGIHPVVGTTSAGRLKESFEALAVDLELEDWFAMLEASQGHKVP
jgi:predicted oxidoreductase